LKCKVEDKSPSLERGFFISSLCFLALCFHALCFLALEGALFEMERKVFMPWKWWIACGVLCMACKKENKEPRFPTPSDILQKMSAREKALSSFSIQVRTEEPEVTVEHVLVFRAPNFLRADVKQPQKLVLSFDGQNHYRLEDAAKKLTILNLHLPTAERKIAVSMLMGALMPEGFQLPKVVPQNLKQSWLEPEGSNRVLRLENQLSDGSDTANIAYVVRWPSLDFLKKEIFADERQQIEVAMQEEACRPGSSEPENKVCFPTRIVGRQNGEALSLQKIELLSFQETISNEHFVLLAPEGFAVERHTLSSLKEVEAFLQ
jgi:hypothetical protein